MAGKTVPRAKLLEMFEMHDRSRIVLAEIESVEKIYIDSGGDDAVRRQQLAEIEVSRRGVLQRIVIADAMRASIEVTGIASRSNGILFMT